MASQGCKASSEDIYPAELTLGLDIDFIALGRLQRKKKNIRKIWLRQVLIYNYINQSVITGSICLYQFHVITEYLAVFLSLYVSK